MREVGVPELRDAQSQISSSAGTRRGVSRWPQPQLNPPRRIVSPRLSLLQVANLSRRDRIRIEILPPGPNQK